MVLNIGDRIKHPESNLVMTIVGIEGDKVIFHRSDNYLTQTWDLENVLIWITRMGHTLVRRET